MDAGPDAVGAAAAGVVGVVLVAVEAALRPAGQVPAQHRPHRFKVVLRVVGRHLKQKREMLLYVQKFSHNQNNSKAVQCKCACALFCFQISDGRRRETC